MTKLITFTFLLLMLKKFSTTASRKSIIHHYLQLSSLNHDFIKL